MVTLSDNLHRRGVDMIDSKSTTWNMIKAFESNFDGLRNEQLKHLVIREEFQEGDGLFVTFSYDYDKESGDPNYVHMNLEVLVNGKFKEKYVEKTEKDKVQ